ncbi:YheU family protein [Oceanobacter mangrovi]|uniref:YheU family protein n=1 Tax=Oceanobacter mangrovi TaxID=2862510 RepID=UPI001FE89194|nr:YheU family protein [Oceanobacter mangrovi]
MNDFNDDAPDHGVIEVPWQQLSPEALDGILGEFVLREGTDYGDYEFSFEDKKQQVLAQLRDKTAKLLFDPIENSCHIELTGRLAR